MVQMGKKGMAGEACREERKKSSGKGEDGRKTMKDSGRELFQQFKNLHFIL